MNYVAFDKMIVWLYQIYNTKIHNKATIHVNDLILTPYSLFDIKCKNLNLMWKTWKCIFRRVSFSSFPKVAFDSVSVCVCVCVCVCLCLCLCVCLWPWIPFRNFADHVIIFYSSSMQHLKWGSLWRKLGNDWKLLLTVFTKSFVLTLTGILDLTLECTDGFRLRQ